MKRRLTRMLAVVAMSVGMSLAFMAVGQSSASAHGWILHRFYDNDAAACSSDGAELYASGVIDGYVCEHDPWDAAVIYLIVHFVH